MMSWSVVMARMSRAPEAVTLNSISENCGANCGQFGRTLALSILLLGFDEIAVDKKDVEKVVKNVGSVKDGGTA